MNNISICTIYAKRKLHLKNLIKGLTNSTATFNELVIVTMNDELPELPTVSFPIKTAAINTDNDFLPLAAARNKAANVATGDKLIFLDVDCISHPSLIETFDYHLNKQDALYQGSIRYLASDWQQDRWTYDSLQKQSSFHRLQGAEIAGKNKALHPYELFWSLCFGIRKKTFTNVGGFDLGYAGYGGEDTDFSFTMRSHNISLFKVAALAYHQFHPSYNPPLNHLAQIVSNARIFYEKWQILPMEKWLKQFADIGYIKLQNNKIEIIRYPTETEIHAGLKQQ